MGDVGDELLLRLERVFQAVEHPVQRPSQAIQLVPLPVHRDASGQILPTGDAVRLLAQLVHHSEGVAGDEPPAQGGQDDQSGQGDEDDPHHAVQDKLRAGGFVDATDPHAA